MKKQRGITLIALVITIIVLLILAGVSIAMLTGENGIIKQAQKSQKETGVAEEKELIRLVASEIKINEASNIIVDKSKLQSIIDNSFGKNNAYGDVTDDAYIVVVQKTENIYEISKNGTIEELGNTKNMVKDETPGELSGSGTESDPYKIQSIEDLVAFSYNVNSGKNNYDKKVVTLERSLYFNGLFDSYVDENAKYEIAITNEDSLTCGYIQSDTANTTIKELVTSNEQGRGFIPIGAYDISDTNTFQGTFDGKENYLYGISINAIELAGVFGKTSVDVTISNFGIEDGNIKGGSCSGGIIGYISGGLVTNCYNKARIIGAAPTGGIVGYCAKGIVENCYNTGNITGNAIVGGIIGSGGTVTNCYNTGNVGNENASQVGGIVGNGGTVENCYNTGNIKGNSLAGGIMGNGGIVENCYNIGNVEGGNAPVGGIIGNGRSATNCYNTGNVNGGLYSGGIIGYVTGGTVINCYNTGNVEGGNSPTGGIAGCEGTIINCYNTGNITGNTLAGGIIGNGGTVTNCYNTGNVEGGNSPVGGIAGNGRSVTNCYNTGNVKGGNNPVGGIIGSGGTVTNCYNTGNVKCGGNFVVGGIAGSGGPITNCHNTGDVSGENASLMGEISFSGSLTNCSYLLKEGKNALANGAEGKEDMTETMDMQKFVDLMNQAVEENNSTESNTQWKKWKLENIVPIFID